MVQFVAQSLDIEVNGETILAFVNSMTRGQDTRLSLLRKHGIDPLPGQWYSQQAWLNAFRELSVSVGEMNLFLVGKAIIDNASFPPISGLQDGLASIDVAYHMNHRKAGQVMFDPDSGDMLEGIGHYRLIAFDEAARTASMVCDNPYPSRFDEGIISQVVRRFKPATSRRADVTLDATKPTRVKGAESCTYIVSW